jgi:hypothetical protein
MCCLCRTSWTGSARSPTCCKASAKALEDQLLKSQKHAAAMQSKLDAAFAKYHNDIQDMQAKSDDLVWKNKTLRNKNKGTPLDLLGSCSRSRGSLTCCALLFCSA